MQTVDIYIDTSIKGPKRRHGSCIYKIATTLSDGRLCDVGGMEVLENTTESSATVYALDAALKRLRSPCSLTIWLNCPHVAAVLNNRWFDKWQKNGWVNSKNEPVCDVAAWQSIISRLESHVYSVRLKEHHQFSDWMAWMIKETDNRKEETEHV